MFKINVSKPERHGRTGVTVHVPEKAWRGYTLYHSRKSERAHLIDMDGHTVHTWQYPQGINWHHCEMLADGHLLVIPNARAGQMMIELDWESALVWKHPSRSHHDLQRLANGDTLTVCHGRAHYLAICERPLLYDYFQQVAPDHQVVWEWHYATHQRDIEELLGSVTPVLSQYNDWPHINTVERLPDTPLGRRDARFRAGNVLFSGRAIHTIGVIDYDTGNIVWAWGPGEILGQHQPTMLENGNILLFDNGNGPPFRGSSRVLEIEPPEGRIVWEYRAEPAEDFWTPVGSGNQRLPNGNTLICAMNWDETGRVFEVTPQGQIVWEFWNPEGDSIYRSYRYALQVVEPLLR